MFPVRCFTCSKPINHLYETYQHEIQKEDRNKKKILDDLKIQRYCCRRMFISHEDVFHDFLQYN